MPMRRRIIGRGRGFERKKRRGLRTKRSRLIGEKAGLIVKKAKTSNPIEKRQIEERIAEINKELSEMD